MIIQLVVDVILLENHVEIIVERLRIFVVDQQ